MTLSRKNELTKFFFVQPNGMWLGRRKPCFPSEYYKYVAYFYRFVFIVVDVKEMILMCLFINRFLTIHVVKHIIIFAATVVYAQNKDKYIAIMRFVIGPIEMKNKPIGWAHLLSQLNP